MLDSETKRRIDTARDILVGKVPDPKSQVEQITIALIYKFMDDMDAEAEEMGGKRKFFTGDFARYGWARLMDRSLGGHEMLGLYGEGITKMTENPGLPPLFRDIFKNAYLPYRDPETLKSFLKIIDEFSYDHSERLGDAFEYLLSVLGSQGDAGQFRTPRHIIDFMVEVIDPKKGETILDPACGTAGFLISAYKHILRANRIHMDKQDGQDKKTESCESCPSMFQTSLTPDERGRLAQNFKGYDISPDMVRLSLVNLYLHGFTDPHIFEYDTLTSEERWNEFADVILANPPFMSPKGGIKPHKRFGIQAKRSEVLFVDYMAEHLTPAGRAAIIVPEGIIFQSQTAYKQLRKMLVENSLVAVVSLPAGCFNPYSGVKTSILILDKSLAKQRDAIAFIKIENDGFGLGAQRRAIEKNDLPEVQQAIREYLNMNIQDIQDGDVESCPSCSSMLKPFSHMDIQDIQDRDVESCSSCPSMLNLLQSGRALIVPKTKIAENGDYNLSGERYRESSVSSHSFPLVALGETNLFRVESGGTPKSGVEEYWNGGIQWATLVDLPATDFISQITTTKRTISKEGLKKSSAKMIPANSVVISTRATIGRIAINRVPIATNQGFKNVVIEDATRVLPEYIALSLTKLVPTMQAWATGGTFAEISKSKFCELQVPLPPLDVQKEIVAEIEGYQKVINGASTVLDHYRPHIPIHPAWPMGVLAGVCTLISGQHIDKDDYNTDRVGVDYLTGPSDFGLKYPVATRWTSNPKVFAAKGDILMTVKGSGLGSVNMMGTESAAISRQLMAIRVRDADPEFIYVLLLAKYDHIQSLGGGAAIPGITREHVLGLEIPLPPLATQRAIVAEIEAEQALVAANRELITRFEQKIQTTLARIWGEESPTTSEE